MSYMKIDEKSAEWIGIYMQLDVKHRKPSLHQFLLNVLDIEEQSPQEEAILKVIDIIEKQDEWK